MNSTFLRTNRANEYRSFRKLIDESSTIIISSHQNPDADAIGSTVAMQEYLRSIGKKSTIVLCDKTPYNLTFLDSENEIVLFNPESDTKLLSSADLVIILDVNTYSRLKKVGEELLKHSHKTILIDHHHDPVLEATLQILDTDCPSTCELLYTLFKADSTFSPSKKLATAIYSGMYTDTGGFRFTRTDAETFLIASELVQSGADPVTIYDEIINSAPIGRMKLVGKVFQSMRLYFEERVCIVSISQQDFIETKTTLEHADGIVATLLEIKGVKLAVMMIEDVNRIKLSFRSKGDFPANHVAKIFDGGGHFNAAGGTLPVHLSLDEAAEKIKTVLEEFSIYL